MCQVRHMRVQVRAAEELTRQMHAMEMRHAEALAAATVRAPIERANEPDQRPDAPRVNKPP